MSVRGAALVLALITAGVRLPGQGVDDRPERSVEDPELQSAINGAIYNGIAWLKSTQQDDGSWPWPAGRRPTEVAGDGTGGLTALSLYALAASGVPAEDPAIERGVAWVLAHPHPFSEEGRYATYSASLLILALTRIDARRHRRLIQRLAARLIDGQLPNGQWTYRLGFVGTAAGGKLRVSVPAAGDNSNSQFAVLGLWAAQELAGARVPKRTWQRIEALYARTQLEGGGWSYRDPGSTSARSGARGGAAGEPKTTMTAAGLVSYVYARAALRGGIAGLGEARGTRVADLGVRAFIRERKGWRFQDSYLVYSIERVGTVLALPEVSWYPFGARKLIGRQAANGRWSGVKHGDPAGVYDTSLALLFLSKATAYPITPRGQERR